MIFLKVRIEHCMGSAYMNRVEEAGVVINSNTGMINYILIRLGLSRDRPIADTPNPRSLVLNSS